MKLGRKRLLAGVLATALCGLAHADGVLINATNRTDMVYDHVRGLIYVANGSEIERYDVVHNYPLSPIVLSGSSLKGMDVSPDGKTLAVADGAQISGSGVIHLVNLDTYVDTQASLAQTYGESGFFDVLYAHDGSLMVTASFAGSGWVLFRKLDPATLIWTVVPTAGPFGVSQNTMLATSANRGTFGLAEANEEPEPVDFYRPATGDFSTGGSQPWFGYDVGVSGDGTQLATPTGGGTFVYDANFHLLTTLGTAGLNGVHPIGLAYDPVAPRLYAPLLNSTMVAVYDTVSFQQVASYDFQDTFQNPSNGGFMGGRTRLSDDGAILMVSVTGGVRFLQMYAPLAAAPVTIASAGRRTTVALQGSVGNNGAIAYALDSQPAHGQAFVDGNTLTYVPAVGYSGTDTFTYAAYYGRAKVTSTVTVTVTADNTAYAPVVSFNTLPVLHSTTAVPGSGHVPGDFTGDGTSDLLWFNPSTSQVGYWTMTSATTSAAGQPLPVTRQATTVYPVTPGYFVGAMGDFNGDGYADLVFTSPKRDLWLWTNDQHGHWSSTSVGTYPANWQLIGAADIDGDGKDDLLWLDPSDCLFAYWLMDGNVRKGYRIMSVACGYYPVGVGYYTSSGVASVLWSSAKNDLYVWDSQTAAFSSYNLTNTVAQLGPGNIDARYIWSFGGGWSGQGIGVEWFDPATQMGFGTLLSRPTPSSTSALSTWAGGEWIDKPESGGYLLGAGYNRSALYVLDRVRGKIGTSGMLVNSGSSYSGVAPVPIGQTWTYPAGWYVIGAPSNGASPLPWR